MKRAMFCCICLLAMLICTFANANSIATPSIESTFLVHLSGAIIDSIDITFELASGEPMPFAFLVPFRIIDNEIVNVPDSALFDYQSFDNYSICICAPFSKKSPLKFTFSNEQKGIYNGITLDGTIYNGNHDLELKIPRIKTEINIGGMISKFDKYCIIQDTPFSSLGKSYNGKRTSIDEEKNTIIEIPSNIDDDIIYRYTFGSANNVDEYTLFNIIIGVVIPMLMTLFSIGFAEKNDMEKLRLRQKVMLVIVILFVIPTAIIWFYDSPLWTKLIISGFEFINIIICVANNILRIRAMLAKIKVFKKT